ncbi:hypothetical protein [Vibrio sp. HA2012]|nr:hypothetical protein [Vibrio sp. HA2012]
MKKKLTQSENHSESLDKLMELELVEKDENGKVISVTPLKDMKFKVIKK